MSSNTGVVIFMCVCILVRVCLAASRHYSRSTGALHAPDAFGAAGELLPQLALACFQKVTVKHVSFHSFASFSLAFIGPACF